MSRLTVFFCDLPPAGLRALPGLPPPAPDGPANVCALFGLHGPAAPLAAITYTHDFGTPPPGWCARLDPVCLLPAGATLRLLPLERSPLGEADARALFERVSSAGVIPQVTWRYAAPLRWYLLGDNAPDLTTCPPGALPAGDVAAGQPRGRDAPRWQAWLNELQMLLFDAPVNQAREARDLPPANALWLWGGGRTPALGSAPFNAVWTDQPLVGGLARLAGCRLHALPSSPQAWLAAAPAGHGLLALGAEALETGTAAAWLGALQAALDAGRLESVTLLAAGARVDLRRRGLLARLRARLRRAP